MQLRVTQNRPKWALLRALPDQKFQNCSLWTARRDAMGTRKISIENPQSVSTCKQASHAQTYQTNQRTCFVIPRSLQNHAPICSPAPIRINSHARRFAIEREHLQTGCIFSCEKRIHIHPNSSMIFAPLSKVKSMEALSCRIYSSPFQWFSLAQHVQFGPCREPILSVNTDPSNWALASYSWRQSKTLLSNSLWFTPFTRYNRISMNLLFIS